MLKIGIIGCGEWGLNFVRVFNQLTNSIVLWCADILQERIDYVTNLYPMVKATNDYKTILDSPEIDAVCIATPASTHYEITKSALLANKHTLVEKPLALNIKEAKELVDLSKSKNKILMVGHTFLFNMCVRKLKEYITQGELGEIYYLYLTRVNLGPIREDVDAITDLIPHDLSIILYLLDQMPLYVNAKGKSYISNEKLDVGFVTLEFDNKVMANVHVSWIGPCKIRQITIIGSEKMVIFDDTNLIEPIKIYNKSAYYKKRYDNYGEFQLVLRDGDIIIPKIELKEPLKNECAHFIECILEDKTPLSDGENGVMVAKILEMIYESLKRNGNGARIDEV